MHLSCLRNPGERLADSQPAAQAQQHQRPSRWLRYRGRGQPKVHTGDLIADESAEFAVAGLEVAQKRRGLAIGVHRTRIIEKLILTENGVLARGGRPALGSPKLTEASTLLSARWILIQRQPARSSEARMCGTLSVPR